MANSNFNSPAHLSVASSTLKEKRTVQLRVVFIKLDEIQTIQEQFTGIIFIRAKWREPGLDNSGKQGADDVNWSSFWDPKLDVQNVKGEVKTATWREIEYTYGGEAYVVEKRRSKGAFYEQMELAHFPFDIQDLSILVTSDLKSAEIDLIEDNHDLSLVDMHAFGDDQEWDLHPAVWTEVKEPVNTEYTQFAHSKPGIYFKCCATRLAGFFIWNIMLIMAIISAMGFVTFAVHRGKPENRIQLSFILVLASVTFKFAASNSVPKISYLTHLAIISFLGFVTFAVNRDKPQNRIQLSFILVLASVTFKFAASNSVPKISYLTHLDRYILGQMFFTFCIGMWHGIVTLVDDDKSARLDFWIFIAFIIVYILLQVFFILLMLFSGYRRRDILYKRDQEYLERAKKLRVSDKGRQPEKRQESGCFRRVKVGLTREHEV